MTEMNVNPLNSGQPGSFGYTQPGVNPAGERADAFYSGTVNTKDNRLITLAVVTDGQGSSGLGGRLAKVAVDTIPEYFRANPFAAIPEMLAKAIEVANRRVFGLAQGSGAQRASTTIAAAAIYNGHLYVANVGNSRIYLQRGNQLLQLTVDHTWAQERIRSGQMSRQDALNNPNAQTVARALGMARNVEIDLGLYLQGGAEPEAQARTQQGLTLEASDVLLLATDGLWKSQPGKTAPAVGGTEMRAALQGYPAQQAAQRLVEMAASRQTGDHATALVVEMPGRPLPRAGAPAVAAAPAPAAVPAPVPAGTPKPAPAVPAKPVQAAPAKATPVGKSSKKRLWLILAAVSLCLVVIAAAVLIWQFKPFEKTPVKVAQQATILQGQVLSMRSGEEFTAHSVGEKISFEAGSFVKADTGLAALDLLGSFRLYTFGTPQDPTLIEFFQVEENGTLHLKLLGGSLFVVDSAAEQARTLVVETTSGKTVITGGVVGNRFHAASGAYIIDCVTGTCTVQTTAGELVLSPEQHVAVQSNGTTDPIGPLELGPYAVYPLAEFVPAHLLQPQPGGAEATPTPTWTQPAQATPLIPPTATRTPGQPSQPSATPTPTNTPLVVISTTKPEREPTKDCIFWWCP